MEIGPIDLWKQHLSSGNAKFLKSFASVEQAIYREPMIPPDFQNARFVEMLGDSVFSLVARMKKKKRKEKTRITIKV